MDFMALSLRCASSEDVLLLLLLLLPQTMAMVVVVQEHSIRSESRVRVRDLCGIN